MIGFRNFKFSSINPFPSGVGFITGVYFESTFNSREFTPDVIFDGTIITDSNPLFTTSTSANLLWTGEIDGWWGYQADIAMIAYNPVYYKITLVNDLLEISWIPSSTGYITYNRVCSIDMNNVVFYDGVISPDLINSDYSKESDFYYNYDKNNSVLHVELYDYSDAELSGIRRINIKQNGIVSTTTKNTSGIYPGNITYTIK